MNPKPETTRAAASLVGQGTATQLPYFLGADAPRVSAGACHQNVSASNPDKSRTISRTYPQTHSPDTLSKRSLAALWPTGVICLITYLLYLPSISFDFTNYDDPTYVWMNPTVQQGLNWKSIEYAFTTRTGIYCPLTRLSFILECTLFPFGPGVFRNTNLLLHLVNVILLVRFLERLGVGNGLRFVTAAVFALHPIQVESVVWISGGRKGLLGTMFALLMLCAYCGYRKGPNLRGGLKVALFYLCSLASKPAFLFMPVLLPFLRHFLCSHEPVSAQNSSKRRIAVLEWTLILMTTGFAALHRLFQKDSLEPISFSISRLATSAGSYFVYATKTIFPADLIIPYRRFDWPIVDGLAIAFLLALITFYLYRVRRERPLSWFGWLWFLVLLFPATGIVGIGRHGIANRYLYLPLVGLALTLTEAFRRFSTPRTVTWLVVTALSVGMVISTRANTAYWRDTNRLFKKTLDVDPYNHLAMGILFREAIRNGDLHAAAQFTERANAATASDTIGLFGAYFIHRHNGSSKRTL